MDEQGWEVQALPRGARLAPIAGVVLAIVVIGALARPPGTVPEAPEGLIDTDATAEPSPSAAPDDAGPGGVEGGGSDGDSGDGLAIEPITAFDPAARWRPIPPAPSGGVRGGAAWDGHRLILWPGRGSGGMYAPDVDAWSTLPPAPVERLESWSATWTGAEVVFFGGLGADGNATADGAALDPVSSRWRVLAAAPVAARAGHAAVLGDGRVWVFGGSGADGAALNDGAVYDPATDTWEAIPASPLSGRVDPEVAWTGTGLLVWGGRDGDEEQRGGASLADGAIYRPASGWEVLPDAPVPLRGGVASTWTGGVGCPGGPACARLLVWGRPAATLSERDGYAYDVASGDWTALPLLLGQTRSDAVGVWTGRWSVVFGGRDQFDRAWRSDGFVYDPATERWKQIPAVPTAFGPLGSQPVVAWTGSELLVWGGGRGARFPIPDDFVADG